MLLGSRTIQTSADPDFVPSEVISGAPEPKPKASGELASSDSVGWPVPERPYL